MPSRFRSTSTSSAPVRSRISLTPPIQADATFIEDFLSCVGLLTVLSTARAKRKSQLFDWAGVALAETQRRQRANVAPRMRDLPTCKPASAVATGLAAPGLLVL